MNTHRKLLFPPADVERAPSGFDELVVLNAEQEWGFRTSLFRESEAGYAVEIPLSAVWLEASLHQGGREVIGPIHAGNAQPVDIGFIPITRTGTLQIDWADRPAADLALYHQRDDIESLALEVRLTPGELPTKLNLRAGQYRVHLTNITDQAATSYQLTIVANDQTSIPLKEEAPGE